ncbi:hypothetical protein F5Y17DRAFT_474318 [Xylariaceae sp. FL0594]|nr:hypothetical protein F5Y17DRAFT_474318 [Xylariaceae sp. FL0594]
MLKATWTRIKATLAMSCKRGKSSDEDHPFTATEPPDNPSSSTNNDNSNDNRNKNSNNKTTLSSQTLPPHYDDLFLLHRNRQPITPLISGLNRMMFLANLDERLVHDISAVVHAITLDDRLLGRKLVQLCREVDAELATTRREARWFMPFALAYSNGMGIVGMGGDEQAFWQRGFDIAIASREQEVRLDQIRDLFRLDREGALAALPRLLWDFPRGPRGA